MIFARGEAALELTGNRVQTGCGVAHDEPWLTGACVASAHRAGLAGIVRSIGHEHSGLCDDAGNGALLLIERKGFDGAGKVFYGIELVVARDDSDSDGVDVGIEEIGAVTGGLHPKIVDDDGAGRFAYIF